MRAGGFGCAALVNAVLVVSAASGQTVGVTLISESGQPALGLNAVWQGFYDGPVVNGSGQLLYRGSLDDGRWGLWFSPDGLTFEPVAAVGEPRPAPIGETFGVLGDWALDRDGGVMFVDTDQTSARLENMWYHAPGGEPVLFARQYEPALDAPNYVYGSFFRPKAEAFSGRTIAAGYYVSVGSCYLRVPQADGSFDERYRAGTPVSLASLGTGLVWRQECTKLSDIRGAVNGDVLVSGIGDNSLEQKAIMFVDRFDGTGFVAVEDGEIASTGEPLELGEPIGLDADGSVGFYATFASDPQSRPWLMHKRPGELARPLFRRGDPVHDVVGQLSFYRDVSYAEGLFVLDLGGGPRLTIDADTLDARVFGRVGRDPMTGAVNSSAVYPDSGGGHGGGGPSPYHDREQVSASGIGLFNMEVDGRMGLYLYDGRAGDVVRALREDDPLEISPGEVRYVRSWSLGDPDLNQWAIDDAGAVYARVVFTDFSSGMFKFELVDPSATCPADVNGDGMVGPGDFNAWIAAYNADADGCDQNGDGVCSPADFNAWILNFSAGC